MKNTETAYITVGKIGSTYGVRGWLKIQSYTEFGASILEYQPWYLSKNDGPWEKITLEDARLHGNGVIAKLSGIETPEAARLLTGRLIAVERSQLPILKKNEYYWSDLEGLTVVTQTGEVLGKVIHLMETGANDVLIVKGTREHAIPYIPSVILNIDLATKQILVDWEPL